MNGRFRISIRYIQEAGHEQSGDALSYRVAKRVRQAADALSALRHFARRSGIPQVVSLKGIGNPGPADESNRSISLGMPGMHGSRAANEAVMAPF